MIYVLEQKREFYMSILDRFDRSNNDDPIFTCDYCGAEIFEGDECCVISGGGVYCARCFSAGPARRECEDDELV